MIYRFVKKIFILSAICISIFSCKKDNQTPSSNTESLDTSAPLTPYSRAKSDKVSIPDFKLRDEKSHALKIVCESLEPNLLDSIIISIYQLNKRIYPGKKFSIAHADQHNKTGVRTISISSFINKIEAMKYYDEIQSQVLSYPAFSSLENKIFAIHNYNANLLRSSKNSPWKIYYDFFEEEYLNTRTDSLRNNFDKSLLYSSEDTRGFNVCIMTTKQDSSAEAAAINNIMAFNKTHYNSDNLRTSAWPFNEQKDITVYLISILQSESDAVAYRNKIRIIYPELENSEIFYINWSNYMTMRSEENVEDYLSFFKATY